MRSAYFAQSINKGDIFTKLVELLEIGKFPPDQDGFAKTVSLGSFSISAYFFTFQLYSCFRAWLAIHTCNYATRLRGLDLRLASFTCKSYIRITLEVKIMLTKKDYDLAEKRAKEIINKSKTDPQPGIELLKKAGVVTRFGNISKNYTAAGIKLKV